MTKAELIATVTNSVGQHLSKRTVSEITDKIFEHLFSGLKKDRRFAYPGFGTFAIRKRAARQGRNPRTNQIIKIPARQTVVFKPSKTFKASL